MGNQRKPNKRDCEAIQEAYSMVLSPDEIHEALCKKLGVDPDQVTIQSTPDMMDPNLESSKAVIMRVGHPTVEISVTKVIELFDYPHFYIRVLDDKLLPEADTDDCLAETDQVLVDAYGEHFEACERFDTLY